MQTETITAADVTRQQDEKMGLEPFTASQPLPPTAVIETAGQAEPVELVWRAVADSEPSSGRRGEEIANSNLMDIGERPDSSAPQRERRAESGRARSGEPDEDAFMQRRSAPIEVPDSPASQTLTQELENLLEEDGRMEPRSTIRTWKG